ncbi:hypothetical protein H4R35_005413 [Dimargaris xerosporica]|nr:hypothetical protein H4R35_005413 [Dimargaris xerosporica]
MTKVQWSGVLLTATALLAIAHATKDGDSGPEATPAVNTFATSGGQTGNTRLPTLPAVPLSSLNHAQTTGAATLNQLDTLCDKFIYDYGIDYTMDSPLYPSDLISLKSELLGVAIDQYAARRDAGLPRNVSLNYLASLQPSHDNARPASSTAGPLTTTVAPLVIQAIESYYHQIVDSAAATKPSLLHQYIYFSALKQEIVKKATPLNSIEESLAPQVIDAVLNTLDRWARGQMGRLSDIMVAWARMTVATPMPNGVDRKQLLGAFIRSKLGHNYVTSEQSADQLAQALLEQFGKNQPTVSTSGHDLKDDLYKVLWKEPREDPLVRCKPNAMVWAQELIATHAASSPRPPLGRWFTNF